MSAFHTYGDGRGARRVYVNGNEVSRVVWANCDQGIVCFIPPGKKRIKRPERDRVYARILRGSVRVEFKGES